MKATEIESLLARLGTESYTADELEFALSVYVSIAPPKTIIVLRNVAAFLLTPPAVDRLFGQYTASGHKVSSPCTLIEHDWVENPVKWPPVGEHLFLTSKQVLSEIAADLDRLVRVTT